MVATISNFSRLSANMTANNALAIYDIFIKNDLEGQQLSLDNIDRDIPRAFRTYDPLQFDMYAIPSSYTLSTRNAYYLNRKGGMYTEMPFSMGIPMNYGGVPRVRFKMVSAAIVEEEPILLIPSYGLGATNYSSARSLEFWINLEPYAALSASNVLPKTINNLTELGGEFSVDSGNATYINDSSAYKGPLNTVSLTKTTASPHITFRDKFVVSGGSNYRFSIYAVNTIQGNEIDYTLNFPDGSKITNTISLEYGPGNFTADFSNEFPTDWRKYESEFYISETIPPTMVTLSIGSNDNILFANTQLGNLDAPMESTHFENTLLEIGGPYGTRISLTADAYYLYLHGYGNSDNYQMGEWARPMYVVCVDEERSFDVYIDTNLVLSVSKTDPAVTVGGLIGNWILLYGSPLFKYVDLSTIAIYVEALKQDIQKYHYVLSYGPSYNDVIANSEYDNIYIADGSATNFTARHLFPLTDSFSEGVGTGINVGNTISIPEYTYPKMMPEDAAVTVVHVPDPEYASYYIKLPPLSNAILDLKDVSINISNLFIGISTYQFNKGLMFRISSPTSTLVAEFRIDQNPDTTHRIYAVIENTKDSVETVWWNVPSTSLKDFVVSLDFNILSKSSNSSLAALFGDRNILVTFNEDVHLRYIGCATEDIMLLNDIEVEYDSVVNGVGLTFGIDILGKINYMAYIVDGRFEIAASGYWTISLPLINFATIVGGKPDLDFLMYFDQTQSPQYVSNLKTRYMTYKEMYDYVDSDLAALTGLAPVGQYSDLYEWAKDMQYTQMGIDIQTSVPTLGRFTDRPITTYITLDSDSRWPQKKYQDLEIELATTSGFIDFQNSPNSVVTTRWELFDGYAIRIPKNINIMRYSLRFAVHLSTFALSTIKPTFNRFELLGVSSGDSPANVVSVGSGSSIVVGSGTDVNITHPFSTHLVGEKVQSGYMSRELGFFPHFSVVDAKVIPINYYLSSTKHMAAISFYMYWRNETFKTDADKKELLATIRYFDAVGDDKYINILVETDTDLRYDYQRGNVILSVPSLGKIYVDTILNGQVEVGRWHLIHITISDAARARFFSPDPDVVKLTQLSDKAVLNYVASHTIPVSPNNLYASRFGLTDYSVFSPTVGEDDYLYIGPYSDAAELAVLSTDTITSGPRPKQVVRITQP